MKRKLGIVVTAMFLAALGTLTLTSCGGNPNETPEQKIAKIASLIKTGSNTAVAMGMMAIPADEATAGATEGKKVLEENVLPILNGDDAALVSGLSRILTLEAFNNPKLAKVKMILSAAMPIVQAYLPAGTVNNATGKIPADVKAYLIAFFQGAHDGLGDYLGTGTRDIGKPNYADLRTQLAKK